MQSPLKRIVVFDFETGGLKVKHNPVTEMAGVVLDLKTLEIVEKFSVMFLPRMDLCNFEESFPKEAKLVFTELAEKDLETGIKSLNYKNSKITLKNLDLLTKDIEEFREELINRGSFVIEYKEYLDYQNTKFKDISTVYLNRSYNPQALEITHISLDLMLKEGVSYENGFKLIDDLFTRHTIGNNKPILSGHNIKGFDIPFMEKIYSDNKKEFSKIINDYMIDTLDLVRTVWPELSSYSLGVCANALGLTLKEAHRALPDTIANANVLQILLANLRGQGSIEKTHERKKFNFNI
jgi:DNA polymerase III alpha subunit (gram-positive type)